MNTEKPIFQSLHEEYSDTKRTNAFKTLPKFLFCGKFNLSEDRFEQGLREGQFVEVEGASGLEYGWRTSTHADTKGSKSATGYQQKAEGNAEMLQKYNEMSKAWKGGISRPTLSAGSSERTLAICDVESPLTSEEWEVAQKQLQQALAALEQQEKNALKYMNQLDDGDGDPLYDVAAHVKSFRELPDASKLTLRLYNNFVEKQGKNSETQEDALAGVAGQLAQRAKRAKKQ
eukprot:s1586_g3.t1